MGLFAKIFGNSKLKRPEDLTSEDIENMSDENIKQYFSEFPDFQDRVSLGVTLSLATRLLFPMNNSMIRDNDNNDRIASSPNYLKDPEYGLVPNKPVFFPGMICETFIVNNLYYKGKSVTQTTRYSMSVDGIAHPVDCYSFKYTDGSSSGDIPEVYVSYYTNVKNTQLPRGFSR